MMNEREDCYNYVPGPDRPIYERVDYVRQRTIAELEIFADDLGLEDVRSMPQNTFTAGLRFCCRMIFRPQTQDKNADYFRLDLADRALVLALSQMFIDLCDRYNKVCQVGALAAFLGVSEEFLYSLSRYGQSRYNNIYSDDYIRENNNISDTDIVHNNNNRALSDREFFPERYEGLNSVVSCDVIKGLKEAKERQLQSLLIDGKGQLVGVIAILNHEFGYSKLDGYSEPTVNLTSAERQKTLADKYRVSALPDKLSDN